MKFTIILKAYCSCWWPNSILFRFKGSPYI